MKENLKKLFITGIISIFFSTFAFADSAEVISVKGKVEVNRGDSWYTLNPGDIVDESEMISTGFQSEAKIKYKDSVMQLGALSRVTLSKLATSASKDVVDIYLNTGAVRSKVNHSSDKKVSYTVRNQIATASVRGTDFISYDDGSVICLSGAVVLTPTVLYEGESPVSEDIEEMEDPADGESNAATPVTDVAPAAPKGGVMVLGGQTSSISISGQAETPFQSAVKEATKPASTVKTQAASEAVTIGFTAAATTTATTKPAEEATPVEPTPVEPTPVEPTPVEPTPVEPTPVEPTPVEPTPVEPTPVEPTPVEPTPVEPIQPETPETGGINIEISWE
ncbi:MAG: FecR domain-containing protein [Treponema sp.]|nr:FecR domain-containing protein [Treponema sp.]